SGRPPARPPTLPRRSRPRASKPCPYRTSATCSPTRSWPTAATSSRSSTRSSARGRTSATASAPPPRPGTSGRARRSARTTTSCCATSSDSPTARSTHSPPRARSTNNLAMPTTNGPEVLGPPPRPRDQKLWDPEMQGMDPEQRRRLQDERLSEMVRKVFENPVALFRRKLTSAGITGADDIKGVDDLEHVPLTVKQDLREAE